MDMWIQIELTYRYQYHERDLQDLIRNIAPYVTHDISMNYKKNNLEAQGNIILLLDKT